MIELKDGINFHNFLLDTKSREWFKRTKKETVSDWLTRIAYQQNTDFRVDFKWRKDNDYWIKSSCNISISVLSFLRENRMQKEVLEDLVGFELDLTGKHDWKLSEIKRLEKQLNKKLL